MNREIDDTLLSSLRPTTPFWITATIRGVRANIYSFGRFFSQSEWMRKHKPNKTKTTTHKHKYENTVAQNPIDIKMQFLLLLINLEYMDR